MFIIDVLYSFDSNFLNRLLILGIMLALISFFIMWRLVSRERV